jgi:MoxR-like ATPase
LKILVGYPNAREEADIVRRMGVSPPEAGQVLDPHALEALQRAADQVFVHDGVLDYAVRLVLATRAPAEHGLPDLAPLIAHGASPRATLGLVAAGRALAMLRGRGYVLSYEAIADGVEPDQVVGRVLSTVVAPRVAPSQDPAAGNSGIGLEAVS